MKGPGSLANSPLHVNVTDHPTAGWTRQQFRAFLDGESGHRYLINDRDAVFSTEVDEALNGFGLKVLKTPVQSPMANAYCQRVIGTFGTTTCIITGRNE
jgi:putative transposase